jgi:hypothetical protein
MDEMIQLLVVQAVAAHIFHCMVKPLPGISIKYFTLFEKCIYAPVWVLEDW